VAPTHPAPVGGIGLPCLRKENSQKISHLPTDLVKEAHPPRRYCPRLSCLTYVMSSAPAKRARGRTPRTSPATSVVSASTRNRTRTARALEMLPLEPNVLVHVFSALSLHHGPEALDTASIVCRTWHQRAAACAQVEDLPDNHVGELRSGDKPYRFDRPHDAVFLPNGDVCVADCDNFRLHIVTREGYYSREVKLGGGTSCPTGVAISGESLFVVEHGAHQVSKVRHSSVSGNRHAVAGGWGSDDGQLRHPWGVAVIGKRVYVTDQGNDRVSVFTDKLQPLFSFGTSGGSAKEFREPRGIAAHGTELYVADYGNHRIQVFGTDETTMDCQLLRVIGGGESSTQGRFCGPSGGETAHPTRAP
jgi:hypothetical protein